MQGEQTELSESLPSGVCPGFRNQAKRQAVRQQKIFADNSCKTIFVLARVLFCAIMAAVCAKTHKGKE
jgi:hypothetical protein